MNLQKQILPAVAAIIFNDQKEVLLQKRNDNKKWSIISGHVEWGETVEQAVVREIYEETNSPAKIVRFIGIYSSPDSQLYHYQDRSVHYITSYFEAVFLDEPLLSFRNEETAELGFFPINRLPADMANIHKNWLKDALHEANEVFIR